MQVLHIYQDLNDFLLSDKVFKRNLKKLMKFIKYKQLNKLKNALCYELSRNKLGK